ncbi:HFR138Wp [Eremothecium sinecaudum]|uniref:HFR138Wp n=1 Tax=Eremothecium sinecaudum TaxID=45286 RepID=A0A120K2M2_9SACH|nr:HFR138Wp [Eremothecium sinecaudum]AMD21993.1 HFR138Wp [Eremothecium sinecaudum]
MVEVKDCTDVLTLNTGAKIPVIGLGTYQADGDDVYKAVLHALKNGYRHIDTAAIYANEKLVGRAIKESGVPREELFITTKLWVSQFRDPERALDGCLKRLGLDYVDLYLLHFPIPQKEFEPDGENLSVQSYLAHNFAYDEEWTFVDTWRLVQKLPETGKARAVGVSNFSVNYLNKLLADPELKVVPAVNQIEVTPYLPQEEVIEFCKSKNILIEAYSPLGSTGAPVAKEPEVIELAEKYGVTPAQVLINYAVNRGLVVLPKSVTNERIDANLKSFKIESVDVEKLNSIHKRTGIKSYFDTKWLTLE